MRDDVEARLRAIREATEQLRPRPGFEVRLARRIAGADVPPVLAILSRRARPLLAAAALVAAAALGLAWHTDRALLDELARAAVAEDL